MVPLYVYIWKDVNIFGGDYSVYYIYDEAMSASGYFKVILPMVCLVVYFCDYIYNDDCDVGRYYRTYFISADSSTPNVCLLT